MPTYKMDDAIAIHQIKAKTLGIAPLAAPARPIGPMAPWTRATPASAVGTRRHIGPIDAQHQHWTPPVTRRHGGDAPLDFLARRRHIYHRQALGHLIRQGVHPH